MEPGAWSAMPGGTNLFPLFGGEEPGKFTQTLTGEPGEEAPSEWIASKISPFTRQQSGTRHCGEVNITVT